MNTNTRIDISGSVDVNGSKTEFSIPDAAMKKDVAQRVITLTNAQPIRIIDADWTLIASGNGDSFIGNDHARHTQSTSNGELDRYILKVRQHNDGRTIVYGIFDAASAWTGHEDRRGGELLTPPRDTLINDTDWCVWDELPRAIRRVGEYCQLPDSIIRDCIADLPPQQLT